MSSVEQGGGNPAMSPLQSYAVANMATFLFEGASKHDKNNQKTLNI